MTTTEKPAETPVDARAYSQRVLIIVAAGALLLGLLLGGAIGAIAFGGDEAPEQKPSTGLPPEPGEGPGSTRLDEDAFAPEGEVGVDQ
ncbi:hypothetical protein ACFU7D_02090 [Nocardioides sp. NPDC057577]|uniref:hypothetical protein n=1 Tax=unclassified Nocardioides TaxID=2615069 RepID=UPI0036532EC9